MIRFVMDGQVEVLEEFDPTRTVLEWLREDRRRTGTKEGCAEGDCGACTVVIGELIEDHVRYRAINACIFFLPMLNGKELVTVEALGTARALHPVQKAMMDCDGSQCGFCTPGFVMSLFARYQGGDAALPGSVDDVLAGNLCRCTGYGPIKRAALDCEVDETIRSRFGGVKTIELLKSIQHSDESAVQFADPVVEQTRLSFCPQTEDDLRVLLSQFPEATIVAGATDVGLWVTKQHRHLETLIFIGEIESLRELRRDEEGLWIGAGVKYADAMAALADLHPDFGELVRRIGSVQVRNSGTIGGNIANGSPIGDTMPPLIALKAELILDSASGERTIPLENYYLSYGKQDRRVGEYVKAVRMPWPVSNLVFRTYKISKRFDQDISAVCGAFALEIVDDRIVSARVAFGGMAATPKRAGLCERTLSGKSWSGETIEEAATALVQDYTPLTDMRASAAYRLKVAQNLLRKVYLETGDVGRTRVLEVG